MSAVNRIRCRDQSGDREVHCGHIKNRHETSCAKSGRADSTRRRPAWEAGACACRFGSQSLCLQHLNVIRGFRKPSHCRVLTRFEVPLPLQFEVALPLQVVVLPLLGRRPPSRNTKGTADCQTGTLNVVGYGLHPRQASRRPSRTRCRASAICWKS